MWCSKTWFGQGPTPRGCMLWGAQRLGHRRARGRRACGGSRSVRIGIGTNRRLNFSVNYHCRDDRSLLEHLGKGGIYR